MRRELQDDFPVESALELPVAESTRKMVNRVRKATEEHMPTPKTLPDVGDNPSVLTTTHEGEFFLHFDSGAHDKERILIFATSCILEILEDCEKWYCDGTFATLPDVFYKVYTIHGEIVQGKKFIKPLVYALLPNKKQDTYSRLLEALQLKPCEVTMDFEIAARNAIKQHNPSVDISYCYFHFCQSLLTQVQSQGTKTRYGTVADEYRKIVRMTAALAFLPPVDCVKGFVCIRKNTADADANAFLDYFEKTSIGLPRNFGSGRRSPRFEIKELSIYSAVISNKNKTNKNVEVWNRNSISVYFGLFQSINVST